jgi:uncharacterized damage-inducible protein DinB
MSIIQNYLKELEDETPATRKMLERVPEGKNDWKPHTKSMELMRLAVHVAELPGWITMVIKTPELDFATYPYNPPNFQKNEELVAHFEKHLAESREALTSVDDSILNDTWKLRNGEQIYFETTKGEILRTSINHLVHHRAQLGVYLRLLDIPIPGSYGPSADEMAM